MTKILLLCDEEKARAITYDKINDEHNSDNSYKLKSCFTDLDKLLKIAIDFGNLVNIRILRSTSEIDKLRCMFRRLLFNERVVIEVINVPNSSISYMNECCYKMMTYE